jgi:hypothetical protein
VCGSSVALLFWGKYEKSCYGHVSCLISVSVCCHHTRPGPGETNNRDLSNDSKLQRTGPHGSTETPQKRGEVIPLYIDEAIPKALKAATTDQAFSRLTDEAYRLLDTSQFYTLTQHVAKPAVVKAYWILQRQTIYGRPVTGHPTLCCPVSSRCLVRYFTNGVPPVPTCDGLLGSVCACLAM